mgnify:CR=1 FL=1
MRIANAKEKLSFEKNNWCVYTTVKTDKQSFLHVRIRVRFCCQLIRPQTLLVSELYNLFLRRSLQNLISQFKKTFFPSFFLGFFTLVAFKPDLNSFSINSVKFDANVQQILLLSFVNQFYTREKKKDEDFHSHLIKMYSYLVWIAILSTKTKWSMISLEC